MNRTSPSPHEVRDLGPEEWERRKAFISFTDDDARLLAQFHPQMNIIVDELLDGMYVHLLTVEETARLLNDAELVTRARSAMRKHLVSLTNGVYGTDYLQERIRVGVTHHRVGVTPRWYIGAYSLVTQMVMPKIREAYAEDHGMALRVMTAMGKIIALDQDLVLSTYFEMHSADLNLQSVKLAEVASEAQAVSGLVHDLSETETPEQIATVALEVIRRSFGWSYGAYWEVDEDAGLMRYVLDSGVINQAFHRVTRETVFHHGEGLNGRAWKTRDLQFIDDLSTARDCPRASAAVRYGVKSGLSVPIVVGDNVLGCLDFCSPHVVEMSESRLQSMRNAVRVISLVYSSRAQIRDARLRDAQAQATAISEASRVLGAMSNGDLTLEMSGTFEGDLATLQADLRRTRERLSDMVSQIREAAVNVSRAAGEINAASTDLSQRTEMQAASLERTAATMEELTSTVRQNADNAVRAAERAAGARAEAEKGSAVVARTVEAMNAIKTSSDRIGDIITTVDEIAFQTNILALNAAVEAARAGDQGRGFAVVASEIRSLAQRSAAAAKEIKSLIRSSVERVEQGAAAVGESGKTLAEIVVAAIRVSDLVKEIAAASREQSAGVEQVSQALAGLEQVTQQNAGMVEESVASADSLGSQAHKLRTLMDFFQLSDEGQERFAVDHALDNRFRTRVMPSWRGEAGPPRRGRLPHPVDEWPNDIDHRSGEYRSGEYRSGEYRSGEYRSSTLRPGSGDHRSSEYPSSPLRSGSGEHRAGEYRSGDPSNDSGAFRSGARATSVEGWDMGPRRDGSGLGPSSGSPSRASVRRPRGFEPPSVGDDWEDF